MMKQLPPQLGISLVEILVALVISVFLLGGIVQVYVGNKTAYRFADATSRILENGRFALDTITRDARMVGFWGCTSMESDKNNNGSLADDNEFIVNHLNTASDNYSADLHDFIDSPPVTATVNDGLNGSDSLTLKGAKPGQSTFTSNFTQPGTGALQVSSSDSLQAGDIILITNCYSSSIFEATAVATADGVTTITHDTSTPASTPGNSNVIPCAVAGAHCLMVPKDKPYTPNNAAAFALQSVTYSIQASASGSGEPALWRSENNNNEELIEGIEQMQLLFGVDTDGDGSPNQYLESDQVADLRQVTAVRLWLVARSERNGVLDSSQTYTINGNDFNEGDLRLRQVFSTTIALRNRAG